MRRRTTSLVDRIKIDTFPLLGLGLELGSGAWFLYGLSRLHGFEYVNPEVSWTAARSSHASQLASRLDNGVNHWFLIRFSPWAHTVGCHQDYTFETLGQSSPPFYVRWTSDVPHNAHVTDALFYLCRARCPLLGVVSHTRDFTLRTPFPSNIGSGVGVENVFATMCCFIIAILIPKLCNVPMKIQYLVQDKFFQPSKFCGILVVSILFFGACAQKHDASFGLRYASKAL